MTGIPLSWVNKKAGIPQAKDDEPVLSPRPQMPLLTPLSNGLSRHGLAVLSKTTESADADPAQIKLDNAPPLSDPVSEAMNQLLAPMVTALRAGHSADEAMNLVAAGYPLLDDNALRELLERAIFVSEVWGRIHAGS